MTRGRDLPSYITRRKRDGVLLFRKRDGASHAGWLNTTPAMFAREQGRLRHKGDGKNE